MKRFLIILVVALLFGCSDDNGNGPENEDLKISILPMQYTAGVDEDITLSVQVENVKELFAVSMEIVFDEDVLQLPDEPVLIGDFWNDNTVELNINDPDRLNIAIGLQQSQAADGISGDGTLFHFDFTTLTTGESDILISNLQMLDENGDAIDDFANIIINEGTVTVE